MPRQIKQIKNFNKQISSVAFKIIVLHLMFIMGTMLTSSFIHILLWRLRSDLGYIAYFDLTFVTTTLVGYIISAQLLTYIKSNKVFRLSFFFIILSYLCVLYWQEDLINHLFLLGGLNGLGNGLYWGAYNILKLRQTTNTNREHYFGIIQGVFTVIATIFPALSGFVIVYLPKVVGMEFSGYYLLYALSAAIFLVMSGYVETLPKVKSKHFRLKDVVKLTNSKLFRDISIYELLAGIYETGSKMVLVVFSFIILNNEFNLGIFSGFFGILSGVYIYFVGRKINIERRAEIILIGALFIFIGRIIFIYFLDIQALVLDRLLETVGGPLFGLPIAAVILSTIESRSNFKLEKEQEYLVASEIPLNFGRFFGSLFFIIFVSIFGSYNMTMIKVWFLVISTTTIVQWYYVKKLT